MAANVETMFYVREKPWHGLGTEVQEAVNSADALRLAGLDWTVQPREIQVVGGDKIMNYKANVRSSDGSVLGVVSDRYQIVQNADAFAFTDELIGGDVRYEPAGSLQGGRKIWLLAKMPERQIAGDAVEPYLCFSNTHDGSGAIRVCMTPIRVVCNNTLNLALNTAKRQWSARHTGYIEQKMQEARLCLELAGEYMDNLGAYAYIGSRPFATRPFSYNRTNKVEKACNYRTSALKAELNGDFLNALDAAGIIPGGCIVSTNWNLAASDGSNLFGSTKCKIGLLTTEQAKRYMSFGLLSPLAFEWTLTPSSERKGDVEGIVANGCSHECAYYGEALVRPAFYVNSSLSLSLGWDEIRLPHLYLRYFSTEQLTNELQRRTRFGRKRVA